MGVPGLNTVNHAKKEVELGYLIAPSHWQKGYATEVCQQFFPMQKEELSMERIVSHVHLKMMHRAIY